MIKKLIYKKISKVNFLIKLKFFRLKNKKIKIIIGAGSTKYKGWISTDIHFLDITQEKDWNKYFKKNEISNIIAEHVFEHLTKENFEISLKIIKKYLKYNGIIRLAVPDANHPSEYYKELVGINGSGCGAFDHKEFYNHNSLTNIADKNGYKIEKIEYFNDNHEFVKNEFILNNGYISRCSINYRGLFTDNKKAYYRLLKTTPVKAREQFNKNNLSYTSLVVDFVKK